jgi:hypothetical protein
MIKAASALLIVALGHFNSSEEKKILPQKSGQLFVEKPYKIPDFKDAKGRLKLISLAQKKSQKPILRVRYVTTHNLISATKKTFQTTFLNSASFALSAKAQAAPTCCCMMMSA